MTQRAPLPDVIITGRLIAVMRQLELPRVKRVAPLLREAGIGALEITLDGEDALKSIRWLVAAGYDVGAGTVLALDDAVKARDAGAAFLVSPSLDRDLIEWATDNSIPFVPGGLTPSEIVSAWALGATAVKLFPASLGGPGYLKDIRGPLREIPIIPTGGVSEANAANYLAAGAIAVGVGGWLTAHDDVDEIVRRANRLAESVSAQR